MKEIDSNKTVFTNLYEAVYNLIALFDYDRVVTFKFRMGYININIHDEKFDARLIDTRLDVALYDTHNNKIKTGIFSLVPAGTWNVEFLSGERDLISEVCRKIYDFYDEYYNSKIDMITYIKSDMSSNKQTEEYIWKTLKKNIKFFKSMRYRTTETRVEMVQLFVDCLLDGLIHTLRDTDKTKYFEYFNVFEEIYNNIKKAA